MQIKRLPTGTPIDRLLGGGLEAGAITNIYGPPGSGKTNIALCALLNCQKSIYIDTEGSFSIERFYQLGGNEKMLKSIIILEPHTWQAQHKEIQSLEQLAKKQKPDLIVVDSLVALYRLELDEKNFQLVNRQLATQYSILSKIARTMYIPILVTNQIYSKGEEIELTSRSIARSWSKCLIELRPLQKPGQRVAILHKHRSCPEGKRVEFEITDKGLKELRFGLF